MSTPPIKISKEAVAHILDVYANQGSRAAEELSETYSVSKHYIRQLAMIHGVRVKNPLRGGSSDTSNDPRWKWAIERGPVLA